MKRFCWSGSCKSRAYFRVVLALMALAVPATRAMAQFNILYCQPNEGNTFNIQSGGTFDIATDCGSSNIVTGPAHGTLTADGTDEYGDPQYLYTPTSGYTGTDAFTVYVSTSTAYSGQQGNFGGGGGNETITLNVMPAPPSVSNASAATAYNTAVTINLAPDITGQNISSVNVIGGPSHGTTSVSGEVVTYTPSTTFYGGTDAFYYSANNSGGTSNTGTVTVTVGPPPAPSTADATTSTAYNTAKAINLAGSITGADVTGVVITGAAGHGTTAVSGEVVTYTPSSTYYGGVDSFTYTAANPGGASNSSTVTVTVGTPASPTTAAVTTTTTYNTAKVIDLTSTITGADITSVAVASAPTHGTAAVNGEVVTYTPSTTYYGGSDSFTYTATNPGGTSNASTVTLNVSTPASPTTAPVATSTAYNTVKAIDLTSSITGTDITSVTIASAPAHGTATVEGEVVTYTPSPSFYGGTDSFTYTATNPGGTSAAAAVSVTVSQSAVPTITVTPTAANLTVGQPTTIVAQATGSGGEGTLSYSIVPALPQGLQLNVQTGVLSGSPTVAFPQTTLTVTVTDAANHAGSASFALTVQGSVMAQTVLPNKTLTTDQAVTPFTPVTASGGVGSLTYSIVPALPAGLQLNTGTGAVAGTPISSIPTTTFTVTAQDGNGDTASSSFALLVQPVPSPASSASTVAMNSVAVFHVTAGLGGAPFTAVNITTAPTSGTAVVNGLDILYVPSTAQSSTTTVTITYTVSSSYGTSAPATITITVTPSAPQVSLRDKPPLSNVSRVPASQGGAA